MRPVIKKKERGMSELRPFASPQEFEEVTGIKVFDQIYLRTVYSDKRIYAHLPYLGYMVGVFESKLVFGHKPIVLETLYCCYEYSLDNQTYKPFGVKK